MADKDKDELFKEAAQKVRDAAKKLEDFADKISADEEPVVIVPDDTATPAPPAKKP